ncbi:MAG: hypothetical protein K2M60_11160 [Lachnospiraceae bacterium]|nr:hypothetical protein [Lachnospiraceae bacterium]MDE6253985.1 hypothetical protein [Lachnospiraceae bacterium]
MKGIIQPSAATLTELVKTYHVSVDWLLGCQMKKKLSRRFNPIS